MSTGNVYYSHMTNRLQSSINGALQIKERRSTTSPGFVYILQCHDYFKIGSAVDPKIRLSLLQTGCPYELFVLRIIPVGNMIERERDLQHAFRYYHHRREWFKVPIRAIDRFMDTPDEKVFNVEKF